MRDWRRVSIGELLILEYGKPLPENARDGQGFPVYGSNGIVGFHSQALVKGPGVVVGRKGSSGVVTFSEGDFSPIDTAFYVSIKDPSDMGMEFTYCLLANAKLTELTTQTGVPGLSRSRAYEARVTVPPLPVQEQIVEIIGAVDDQITALDAESEAMHAVLRRRRADLITDDSVEAVRAEHAFDFSTGVRRTPDRATGPYMTPYLRSANVGYGTLDLSDVLEMNYDPAEREKFGLRYGDVLVSEGSASANAVGMPAMWRDELAAPVCTQMTLLRLRALEGVCIPEFVFHWSMWAYESRAFLDVAGGTNIKHISAKRSKGMAVRLPSLDRQREMAVELDAMESALEATRAESARLRGVRAGLLSGLLDRTIDIESAELEV
ncbi:restriction endonuclease subunit S [Streptomyces sp. NBC_01298]|uniref:restriction endonuclease subunit S n=1 Tax=Streptomyces sp. NBC_01298 TaxID=2903817 RepID=UPI002E10813D|nr:restriction endonuclease subunit S [Streptomyces sp. NBC_01298]